MLMGSVLVHHSFQPLCFQQVKNLFGLPLAFCRFPSICFFESGQIRSSFDRFRMFAVFDVDGTFVGHRSFLPVVIAIPSYFIASATSFARKFSKLAFDVGGTKLTIIALLIAQAFAFSFNPRMVAFDVDGTLLTIVAFFFRIAFYARSCYGSMLTSCALHSIVFATYYYCHILLFIALMSTECNYSEPIHKPFK